MTASKKNHHFEVSSSLILYNNIGSFLNWTGAAGSEFYVTTGDNQLSGWTEKKL